MINFIYLYDSLLIPIAHSYIIEREFILNQIGDVFEKCITRGCGKVSVNISINKTKQNRTTGRPKGTKEDNIKKILKERFCDVNWIKLLSDNATLKVTEKLNITYSS